MPALAQLPGASSAACTCQSAWESANAELLTNVGSSQAGAPERSLIPDMPAAAVFMLSARTCNFVRWRAWRILNLSPALAPCKRPYSATSEDGPNEDVAKRFIRAPYPGRQFPREEVSRGGMGPGLSVRQKRVGAQVMAALARELQHGPLRDPLMQDCGFGFLEVRVTADLRTAHILWSAADNRHQAAENLLRSHMRRLRSSVFSFLNLPFSPTLQFRRWDPSKDKYNQELEAAFLAIKDT